MKTTLLVSTIILALISVGCSKSNSGSTSNNDANANNTVPPPVLIAPDAPAGDGTTGGGSTGAGTGGTVGTGATVAFNPTSLAAMRSYVLPASPHAALNNPTNIKISLNLTQAAGGRYGGSVTISYVDNGKAFSGTLTAGTSTNYFMKDHYDNDKLQAEYNYFFDYENQLVFTGFFEDGYGAITLTLTPDEPVGGGNDAEPLSQPYKGQIYFKNFKNSYGSFQYKSNPYRSCWFISAGVFDCRSNIIQSKCGLEPGVETGYTLLGTFTNVDIKKAFNIQ